jgi:hypothetical protein
VAHVEVDLHSFDMTMPEEINRVLTEHVPDLLFCTTETAVKNIENKGIAAVSQHGRCDDGCCALQQQNSRAKIHNSWRLGS